MKKLDKLILSSFLGPFFLTFVVVVFILLTQHMLKYFDDIVGKGLGVGVIGQLLVYFAVFMTPVAMPLAILLSSLMTFGNLGEHFELTAIKSAGISLLRALMPIFSFVLLLTVLAFYSNNYLVPKAALNAYSLLYDIKQKKPALDLKEGAFYNGIPDFSIKISEKFPDGITIKDVIIYDHTAKEGNKQVTLADSGRMSTFLNDRYLKFQLFNGNTYEEYKASAGGGGRNNDKPDPFGRVSFKENTVVMDLSSFELNRTDKGLFSKNRIMRNLNELVIDEDSIKNDTRNINLNFFESFQSYMSSYQFRNEAIPLPDLLLKQKLRRDSLDKIKYSIPETSDSAIVKNVIEHEKDKVNTESEVEREKKENDDELVKKDSIRKIESKLAKQAKEKALQDSMAIVAIADTLYLGDDSDSVRMAFEEASRLRDSTIEARERARIEALEQFFAAEDDKKEVVTTAVNQVRQVKSRLGNHVTKVAKLNREKYIVQIQWHKILSNSVACIIMFLIGAPLGAIIKRGGLGMPVILSIIFFITFYVINMTGEKWSRQGAILVPAGMWAANYVLLPFGMFFLRQARNDARLFDADFYSVFFNNVKNWFNSRKKAKSS